MCFEMSGVYVLFYIPKIMLTLNYILLCQNEPKSFILNPKPLIT